MLTLAELVRRYPGVEFLGEPTPRTIIRAPARIDAGATIDLAGALSITGSSHIKSKAIVKGCDIDGSTIDNDVEATNSNISHSRIHELAKVTDSKLVYSTVTTCATVQRCTLTYTTVEDSATITSCTFGHYKVEASAKLVDKEIENNGSVIHTSKGTTFIGQKASGNDNMHVGHTYTWGDGNRVIGAPGAPPRFTSGDRHIKNRGTASRWDDIFEDSDDDGAPGPRVHYGNVYRHE